MTKHYTFVSTRSSYWLPFINSDTPAYCRRKVGYRQNRSNRIDPHFLTYDAAGHCYRFVVANQHHQVDRIYLIDRHQ